jgi:hypothetical protein
MAPASVAIVATLISVFLLITALVCMARGVAEGFALRMFGSRTQQQSAEGSAA